MLESIKTVLEALPNIIQGSGITIILVLGSLFIGFLLGLPLAIIQVYANKYIAKLVSVYVWFFRGMPVLLLLFLFYFGLFDMIGLDLGTIGTASVVLGLASSAYQSQIFRGAIQSLPSGQFKAAKALGMSDFTAIKSIVLPQALRLSIPAWSNEYSILLKDSAMCFALGTPEIMARTHFAASRTYEHLPLYITAGLLYLIITLLGIKLLRLLEKKVRLPGYAL